MGALTIIAGILAARFLEPSPPKKIVLATGLAGWMYNTVGREYKQRLEKLGLLVELVETNGSVENLERTVRGQADVAFAQSGTVSLVSDPNGTLRGLAALYVEPLWVFCRGRLDSESLSALRGRRIAVGPPQSGTEAVAKALLA